MHVRQDNIHGVVKLTQRRALRALYKRGYYRALSRGSAEVTRRINMADAGIDERLRSVELHGIAGLNFIYLSSCAVDILRLIRLNFQRHAAERIDKLREAFEIDADIMIYFYLVVVFERFYKNGIAAPSI